jgi:HEAT repeats
MQNRLEELFAATHRLNKAVVGQLTSTDLDDLRSIASGRRVSAHRIRALEALVLAAPSDAAQVLADVLADPQNDPGLRAAAASQLARTGSPSAEDVLLRNLESATDVTVRTKIIGGLARIGSTFSIEVLDRLTSDSEPAVSRLAAFSRRVIAYRGGLHGYSVPAPGQDEYLRIDVATSAPLVAGIAGEEEARATFADIGPGAGAFSLDLSSQHALQIECGLTRMLLAPSEQFVRRGVAGLLRRPMLPALIAQRAPSDGSYSVRMVVLAGPEDGGIFHIAVYRTEGTLTMFGLGAKDDEGATFELRSVQARGNHASLVRGRLQSSAIVFTEAAVGTRIEGQSSPQPLTT